MSYNQITNPSSLPITLQQVKEWTRVDDTASDAELTGLIQAATKRAEVIMDRPIINRQYTLTLDEFPEEIQICKLKLQSVESITYVDADGATQTLSSANYLVNLGSEHAAGEISEAYNTVWPTTRDQDGTVIITFTAGYGADWNSVPADIQQAIAYLVSHYYDTRDIVGENKTIPETAVDILMGHRVYSV